MKHEEVEDEEFQHLIVVIEKKNAAAVVAAGVVDVGATQPAFFRWFSHRDLVLEKVVTVVLAGDDVDDLNLHDKWKVDSEY